MVSGSYIIIAFGVYISRVGKKCLFHGKLAELTKICCAFGGGEETAEYSPHSLELFME